MIIGLENGVLHIVDFESQNAVNKALKKNGDMFKGEKIIIQNYLESDINIENTQKYEYDMDIRNYGQKVGIDVYTFQNPKIMEEKTEIVNANGVKYKMGFMLRVKPDKIRIPQSNNQVWVVNGISEEIRPYGILLKRINY